MALRRSDLCALHPVQAKARFPVSDPPPRLDGTMCSMQNDEVENCSGQRQYSQRCPARTATRLRVAGGTRTSDIRPGGEFQAAHETRDAGAAQTGQLGEPAHPAHVECFKLIRHSDDAFLFSY